MAETVTVPGVGTVGKQTVVISLAVGSGILGWAWWQKRKANQAPTAVMNTNDAVGAVAYTGAANTAGATGDSTVNGGILAGSQIATNGQWTQAAIQFLSANGNFDPGALATALGKYINRDPSGLTDTEVAMVQAARGAFGDPPVGGPYAIIHATPTPGSSGNGYPGDGTPEKPPITGANPHVWMTLPGDTLLNLVPRLYQTDPSVNPPTDANLQHRTEVAQAIYATNIHLVPPGITTPLPAGIFITYY